MELALNSVVTFDVGGNICESFGIYSYVYPSGLTCLLAYSETENALGRLLAV